MPKGNGIVNPRPIDHHFKGIGDGDGDTPKPFALRLGRDQHLQIALLKIIHSRHLIHDCLPDLGFPFRFGVWGEWL